MVNKTVPDLYEFSEKGKLKNKKEIEWMKSMYFGGTCPWITQNQLYPEDGSDEGI